MAKEKENQTNLRFYEQLRKVPAEALKQIKGGRLSGMSDINPMFRIKAMTEAFGVCGFGWKYEITKQWHETFTFDANTYEVVNGVSTAKQVQRTEIKAFCNINLYVKIDGEWSEPIPGLGGSTVMTYEKNGYYVSDEADKMALTDAMGVAMKALGVAADVYWEKGQYDSKYDQEAYVAQQIQQQQAQQIYQQGTQQQPMMQQPVQQPIQQPTADIAEAQKAISGANSVDELMTVWANYPSLQQDKTFRDTWATRRSQVEGK